MNNNKKCISASMMCARIGFLKQTLEVLEKKEIDYLHIDVMDGYFVPNLGLGTDYIKGLRSMTSIPLDIHLMIDHPEDKLDWFGLTEKDIVSIHYESTRHIQKTLANAKKYGSKIFLAINPGTSIYLIEEILDDIDGVNLLTVNPGFAGQKIVPHCIEKARHLKEFLEGLGCSDKLIEVDGNINNENASLLSENGADIFVAGSSSIFSGIGSVMEKKIVELRETILKAEV